jgi:hypothetical protein
MHTHVETITPERARALLGSNGNRPLRKTRVLAFVEVLKRGHWRLSHQGIAIAADGRVLDGQHRLAAIAEADVTVQMCVTYDVPPECVVRL